MSNNNDLKRETSEMENKFVKDWNEYSRSWEQQFGDKYTYLGDEWNDDATQERTRDEFYFATFADRFLRPKMTALEIGPGGGKWSVRLAPRVKKLIVLDVAQAMLDRTQARLREANLHNGEFVLGNCKDFRPIPDACVNFIFSYDVFVHLPLEETFAYIQEMNRVLKGGGMGVIHHAINSTTQACSRIEKNIDWYRSGNHTLGQFYYYSPESLRAMYEHCGVTLVEQFIQGWNCTCIFTKARASPLPRLEQLLAQLLSAEAAPREARAPMIQALQNLPDELEKVLQPSIDQLIDADDPGTRATIVETIRGLWRGFE
ncbi:MAG: class I SAM-dependent methyltransferase [Planctomycetota bacterium]|nr:class I SAM-dependent methyltransferase [Planctomycetota bacterium]